MCVCVCVCVCVCPYISKKCNSVIVFNSFSFIRTVCAGIDCL